MPIILLNLIRFSFVSIQAEPFLCLYSLRFCSNSKRENHQTSSAAHPGSIFRRKSPHNMDSFMADELQPQRFIPFRKSDVVEMCLTEGRLPDSAGSAFRDFCRLLEALFHFEFHRVLERLKDGYAPFDPDADTRQIIILPDSDRERLMERAGSRDDGSSQCSQFRADYGRESETVDGGGIAL